MKKLNEQMVREFLAICVFIAAVCIVCVVMQKMGVVPERTVW